MAIGLRRLKGGLVALTGGWMQGQVRFKFFLLEKFF